MSVLTADLSKKKGVMRTVKSRKDVNSYDMGECKMNSGFLKIIIRVRYLKKIVTFLGNKH